MGGLISRKPRASARKHFDVIDRNGDGSLDREELNTLSKPAHGQ